MIHHVHNRQIRFIITIGMGSSGLCLACLLFAIIDVTLGSFPDFPLTKGELKVKAGYFTESGKYLGGIPKFDNEIEYYDCLEYAVTNTSSAATNTSSAPCVNWIANEAGGGEYELGECTCKSVQSGKYCEAWTCSQVETDTSPTCVGSEPKNCYFEVEGEGTRCSCEREDESGYFCASWTCLETDSDGNQEDEVYTCARVASSGLYCEAWTGVTESVEEVEASVCECLEEWNGEGTCSYWECEERGMNKCSRGGKSWCNLGVSVGVGGTFGFLGIVYAGFVTFAEYSSPLYTLPCTLLWCSLWAIGVVIWGGQDGAIYAGTWWALALLVAFLSPFSRCD